MTQTRSSAISGAARIVTELVAKQVKVTLGSPQAALRLELGGTSAASRPCTLNRFVEIVVQMVEDDHEVDTEILQRHAQRQPKRSGPVTSICCSSSLPLEPRRGRQASSGDPPGTPRQC